MAVVESAVKDALASVDVGGIDPMGAPWRLISLSGYPPYVTNCCNEGDVIEALKDMLSKGMKKCRQFYKVKGPPPHSLSFPWAFYSFYF